MMGRATDALVDAVTADNSKSLSLEAFAWKTFLSTPTPEKGIDDPPAPRVNQGSGIDSGVDAANAVMSSSRTALLSAPRRLMMQYRVQKKMVLWDAVLAAAWAETKHISLP